MRRHFIICGVLSAMLCSCLMFVPGIAFASEQSSDQTESSSQNEGSDQSEAVGRTGSGVTEVTVVQHEFASKKVSDPVAGNVTKVASVLPSGTSGATGASGSGGGLLSKTGDVTRFEGVLAFAVAGVCLAGAGVVSKRVGVGDPSV